ncbi:MAG: hypothetical protein ACE366_04690 [Bradymonadia bacterium]
MSISSSGKHIAFASEHPTTIFLVDVDSVDEACLRLESRLFDVQFDHAGRLWTLREGDERFVLEIYDARGRLQASIELGDDYFLGGGAILRSTSGPHAMLVDMYSGQSESMNFLCTLEHAHLHVQHLAAMDGEHLTFAGPHSTLIALDKRAQKIICFESSHACPSEAQAWPYNSSDADERPGYFGSLLDEERFLASSEAGRLFVFGLAPLRVIEEIHVIGHAPVSAIIKCPNLTDAHGPVSALLTFARCGDCITAAFVHPSQPSETDVVMFEL